MYFPGSFSLLLKFKNCRPKLPGDIAQFQCNS